jgi:hypothetical protein
MVVCELVVSKWIVCPQGPILATRWCHPLSCVSSLTPIRLYIFHEPSWLCLSNTSWTSVTRGITLHGNWTTNKCRYGHILLMSLSITLSMGSSGAKLGIQPTMNTYEYLWKHEYLWIYGSRMTWLIVTVYTSMFASSFSGNWSINFPPPCRGYPATTCLSLDKGSPHIKLCWNLGI